MVLTELKSGQSAIIKAMNACVTIYNRLASMGISENSEIKIVQNSGRGPVIIESDGRKIALGRGMSKKINVEVVLWKQ